MRIGRFVGATVALALWLWVGFDLTLGLIELPRPVGAAAVTWTVASLIFGIGLVALLPRVVRRRTVVAGGAAAAVQVSSSRGQIADEYGSAEFGWWVESLAEPGASLEELLALAAERRPDWADSEKPDDPRPIASHEAAHAVVAHHFGCVLEVTIKASEAFAGHTRYVSPKPEKPDQEVAWTELCVALAGRVSDQNAGRFLAGSNGDMERSVSRAATVIATGMKPAGYDDSLTIDALLVGATGLVRGILDRRAADVNALAAALLERTTLRGCEARSILARAGGV